MDRRSGQIGRIRHLMWGVVGSVLLTVALGSHWFIEAHALSLQAELLNVQHTARELGLDSADMAAFARQHQALMTDYHAALTLFDSKNPLSPVWWIGVCKAATSYCATVYAGMNTVMACNTKQSEHKNNRPLVPSIDGARGDRIKPEESAMLKNITLNRKLIVMQSVSIIVLIGALAFCLFQLADLSDRNKAGILNAHDTLTVMIKLDNMNIAVIREAKAAKDVWLRGNDPDEKYKMEFTGQVDIFNSGEETSAAILNKLSNEDSSFRPLIEELSKVSVEHKKISEKYLAQIIDHQSAADSDAKVKGIERALFRQIQELRSALVKIVEAKGAQEVVLADERFNACRNTLAVVALLSVALLFAMSTVVVRSVARQLGGDPQDVLEIIEKMATGDLLVHLHKKPADGSVLAHVCSMQSNIRDMIVKVTAQANNVGHMAHSLTSAAQQIAENTSIMSQMRSPAWRR